MAAGRGRAAGLTTCGQTSWVWSSSRRRDSQVSARGRARKVVVDQNIATKTATTASSAIIPMITTPWR